ncbi:hypothetical protein [Herbidospora mongoliensis]|uniref:hypothetical protein n=1 Tax=Herbidospora mongoliensis TaxID=688067 RepID=UPI00083395DF|nr:hypothetical protein [Herbidospora mongoliensis]
MSVALTGLLAALGGGIVDAQLELDERARDSLDAFGETGVPPTAFTWSSVRLSVPLAMRLKGSSLVATGPDGGATLTVRLAYLPAEQEDE